MSSVIAILCSDIHLCHNAPVARSAEPDWYEAMKRPLRELAELSNSHGAPIVCAGDVFDRWKSPPELINFAIDYLPEMWAIPGQHDLPNHRLDEVGRSAYGTLVREGTLKQITPGMCIGRSTYLHPFPWGEEIAPRKHRTAGVHLAVIHSYIWKQDHGYHGASETQKAPAYRKKLQGYNAAVFGDNHIGFTLGHQSTQMVMNCGTLMRRKSDERSYRPQVGLLCDDGHIGVHYLDTSKDLFLEETLAKAKEEQEIDVSRFLDELKTLGMDSLDYRQAVNHYLGSHDCDDAVRELVLEAIETV